MNVKISKQKMYLAAIAIAMLALAVPAIVYHSTTAAVAAATSREDSRRAAAAAAAVRASDWIMEHLPEEFYSRTAEACGGRKDLWAFNRPGHGAPACERSILGSQEEWLEKFRGEARAIFTGETVAGDRIAVAIEIDEHSRVVDGITESYSIAWKVKATAAGSPGYAAADVELVKMVPNTYKPADYIYRTGPARAVPRNTAAGDRR